MNVRTLISAIVLSAGLSTAAGAATINLNVNKGWSTGAHSYTNGSETVTAEAYQYNAGLPPTLFGDPAIASWGGWNGGIGVCSGTVGQGGTGGCSGDAHTVDGSNPNEIVVFDFGSTVVDLTGITFAYVDDNDEFDVFTFGNGAGAAATDWAIDRSLPNNCSVCFTTNFNVDPGSVFGIGAFAGNSEWKIKKIHYNVISTIPLPAGLPLLLGGLVVLGGVGAARRRPAAA